MFTVKHIQHGIENLYPAIGVTHRRSGNDPGVEMLKADGSHHLFAGMPRPEGHGSSNDQTIFVMNENGKTVARYDL